MKKFIFCLVLMFGCSSLTMIEAQNSQYQQVPIWPHSGTRTETVNSTLKVYVSSDSLQIHSNNTLSNIEIQIQNMQGSILYDETTSLYNNENYYISIDYLLSGNYKIIIMQGTGYISGTFYKD